MHELDRKPGKPVPSLGRAIYGYAFFAALISAVTIWWVTSDRLAAFQENALIQAVEARGRGAALDFARLLHQEWQRAEALANSVHEFGPETRRSALDLVAADGSRIAWAALANSGGRIASASGGLLEGQDVSSERWFGDGLRRRFVGVQEAQALTDMFPDSSGRFLQFAAPMRGDDNVGLGVVTLLMDMDRMRLLLQGSARAMQLDLYVLDRAGQIVLATDRSGFEGKSLRNLYAAMAGIRSEGLGPWRDTPAYYTTVIPNLAYEDLPPLGWSMVARVSSDTLDVRHVFSNRLAMSVAALGIFLAVFTFLFVQLFARPLNLLAKSAAAIADGAQEYPPEARTTREAILIGAAIVRLQSIAQTRRRGGDAMVGGRRRTDVDPDRRQDRQSGSG